MPPDNPFLEVDRDPQVERTRINFSWILKLRWAAVCGQLAVILVVTWGFGVELETTPLLGILLFEAFSNVALEVWFHSRLKAGAWERSYRRGETLLGSVMVGDIGLLTVLLFLTGGPSNPFSIFYLVNIVLSAVVLHPGWAWVVTVTGLAGWTALFFDHRPLPELEAWMLADSASVTAEDVRSSVRLYWRGLVTSLVAAGVFVAYFVTRVRDDLDQRERELNEERQKKARSERLEALATLAAGAAHELSSPLSTIAVVAKELELELKRRALDEVLVQDAHLIRDEVARCRTILDRMSVDAGESRIASLGHHTMDEVVRTALEDMRGLEAIDLRISPELDGQTFFVARRTLALALRGVIKNALDASPPGRRVGVECTVNGEALAVDVRDRGSGMAPAVVARASEPFFTTKQPGQGMGLGLFLARSVIERLGGSLEFESAEGRGTTARIRIPLAQLRPAEG